MMSKLRVWQKIFLSYLGLVVISMVTVGIFVTTSFKSYYLQGITSNLKSNAFLVNNLIKQDLVLDNINNIDDIVTDIGVKIGKRITIIDRQGKVLGDSEESSQAMENHAQRPEVKKAYQGKVATSMRYSDTLDIEMLYLAVPIFKNDQVIGVSRISLPLTEVHQHLDYIYRMMFLSAIIALLIAFWLGLFISRKITRPLGQMTLFTKEVASGKGLRKIAVSSRDEVGELADSFNHMVEQLKSKIDIITKDSNQMRAILSSVIEGVIAVDSKQRIILFNSAFRKMFGLNKVKVIERPFWEVLRNEQLNNLLQQVINKGDLQTKELSLFFPEERVFKVHALPIHRRKQNAGAVAVLHDITEIKKIEKMRIDFVANVSHELRTPLTSIKGFIETLKDGAIDDPQNRRRFLEIIESQADRLNNLIADLLQLSKIESKNIAIKFETTDIKELTQQVLANFSKTIQGKGHKIAIKFSEYFPKVKADPVKIEQVLINLISNAVKFTPNGGKIEIKGYCLDNQVKVEICDNGVGIAKEHLGRIFERFYRVDKARSREMGGTGLGLSIVKHIVQAHGGVVGADSQAGKGSCFYFFLPR